MKENENKENDFRLSIMFTMFILLAICIISVITCRNKAKAQTQDNVEVQQFKLVDSYYDNESKASFQILYDTGTRVKYLIVTEQGTRMGMTPLYNADGTLQLYDDTDAETEEK